MYSLHILGDNFTTRSDIQLMFVSASIVRGTCKLTLQVQEIRNCFLSAKLPALEDITVTTIDSFQVGKGSVTRWIHLSELYFA